MTTAQEQRGPWETESGLIDDVDAWIANPHFGIKEEYSQVVVATTGGEQKGAMILFDLTDENGEVLGSQGYSIGTGWEISEDGLTITHAKRKNVVTNTLYGQLQNRVVKELGVDMSQYGLPTDAMSWDGLGFHWMQQLHTTVAGPDKPGLMPTTYLGKVGEEAAPEPAPVAAPTPAPAPRAAARPVAQPVARPVTRPAVRATPGKALSVGEAAAAKLVTETGTVKEFILRAVKIPEIIADDPLMAQCLDDSATGFFRSHKGK